MYKPRRTMRYHYVTELIDEIEEHQCETCVFRKTDADWPMCDPIGVSLITELPVEGLAERADGVVVCTRYKKGEPLPPHDPEQGTLL